MLFLEILPLRFRFPEFLFCLLLVRSQLLSLRPAACECEPIFNFYGRLGRGNRKTGLTNFRLYFQTKPYKFRHSLQ